MLKSKLIKRSFLVLIIIGTIGAGIGLYMFNMPARDVQATKTDFAFDASTIVNENSNDALIDNQQSLDEEADSKNLEIKREFDLTLADYGVAFEKGKPSTNIGKTVKVTFEAEYQKD